MGSREFGPGSETLIWRISHLDKREAFRRHDLVLTPLRALIPNLDRARDFQLALAHEHASADE